MYLKFVKRLLDFFAALAALLILSPLLLVLTAVGAICMRGNPFFLQPRPGKDERIFKMIKFRSMSCAADENGDPLPDEARITKYGRFIRGSSLDELPELLNILKGDMSFVGPRPQLVRDMVFMTPAQRKRHTVRPGLTGLAQVSGRNALVWDKKLALDLEYIADISFVGDIRIIFRTAKLILFGGETSEETDLTADFGDYLLEHEKISEAEYRRKMEEADQLVGV